MTLNEFIQLAVDNYVYTAIVVIIITLVILRIRKTIRIHIGSKKYVKKSRKLRKRKFNGITLVDKIKRKRKKKTNNYLKLTYSGKRKVKKYLNYKSEELPIITKYSYGKLFKRSNNKLIIFAKRDKKIIKRVNLKKGPKNIIDFVNRYECLNEMIVYLHNLPVAILDQQDYELNVKGKEISLGYKIK